MDSPALRLQECVLVQHLDAEYEVELVTLSETPLRVRVKTLREIAVEHMWVHRRLRPKPDPLMLRRLLARERIAPSRAILVEDTLSHLKRYRRLGIGTVWVTGYLRRVPPGVQPTSAADALHPMQAAAVGARANSPHQPAATPILFANRPGYVSVKVKSVLQLKRRLVRRG
jgi:putative hydrolase of the HAD superfamily